jgi:tetratricopeptide (TPR) repeat protein
MKFDDPNSEQLDFDANLRKKGATLHSWAMEYLALEDKKVKQTKSYKSKIAAIRKLAKKKATRAEANLQIREMISSPMPELSHGYQGHLISLLGQIAGDTDDPALSTYCLATAYRMMRGTPALRALYSDYAYYMCESISEKYRVTVKKIKRKRAWAIRATRGADGNYHDFNWLPLAWHDAGICAYIQNNYSQAETAFKAAIQLRAEHPRESGYFICDLHIKQAEVMRGLNRRDEELAHFETAKTLLNDIPDPLLLRMMQRHLKWALARSARSENSAQDDQGLDNE